MAMIYRLEISGIYQKNLIVWIYPGKAWMIRIFLENVVKASIYPEKFGDLESSRGVCF